MPQQKYNYKTWVCCNCGEAIQTVAVNLRCSNGLCQHIRCDECRIDGYGTHTGLRFPPSPIGISRSPLNTLELSEETTERLVHLNELKVLFKATFDKAAKKHKQGTSTSNSNSDYEELKLERYLYNHIQPTEFVFAWEWSILPFLVEIVPKYLGRGFAINVRRDPRKNSAQTICLTTRVKPTRTRRMIIARHVLDLIPDRFYKNTSFQFCHGMVEFIKRGTDKKHPDDVCNPRNPHFYVPPMMGDSIGPSTEECAGTLGPCLKFGDEYFWLANLHLFLKQLKSRQVNLVLHPGLLDKDACGHSVVKSCVKFGILYAYSGNNLTTTRPSSHPFWEIFPESTSHDVVTDWVLIDDLGHTELDKEKKKKTPLLNTLRIPGGGRGGPHITVTKISPVLPEAKVHTTGRTSGYQYGQICEIPAYLDADSDRKTTKPTREWYVEPPNWIADSEESWLEGGIGFPGDSGAAIIDSEESWLEGGIGVPGDSGAAVIDSDNNSLYGQIWGRNKYFGEGPRIAYFTAMSDISKDIEERCPQLKGPLALPQLSSRERTVLAELYCPECSYLEGNATPPSISDVSEELSLMSISSPGEFNSSFDDRNLTDRNPPDLQHLDVAPSDNDELISTDSGDTSDQFAPMDQDEFEELLNLLPPATNDEHALEMVLDPYQYYNNLNTDIGVNDETLSIDEDDNDGDDDIPARSFACKKKLPHSVPREKLSGSWVIVRTKPKDTTKETLKRASKQMTLRRKEACSYLIH